ncbi:hypothetical protein CALVIDRAFT_103126 [Calocera viscosa TUFC12733]|uniref:Uncharacterized protein n=1 Tax=Calocera viscosa (strain TUFC12733) TaxID=1330018 RepID=A0A167MN61_CALVF|nr:hypothetical protein CALVIDRAFT_103126 [Calocera viscosa TUFC12733]
MGWPFACSVACPRVIQILLPSNSEVSSPIDTPRLIPALGAPFPRLPSPLPVRGPAPATRSIVAPRFRTIQHADTHAGLLLRKRGAQRERNSRHTLLTNQPSSALFPLSPRLQHLPSTHHRSGPFPGIQHHHRRFPVYPSSSLDIDLPASSPSPIV